MKRKKNFYLALSILLVIVCAGYTMFYSSYYDIEDNTESIHLGLSEWMNGNVEILKVTQLDKSSTYIVLFERDDKYTGFAHMKKGWNGRFVIKMSGEGEGGQRYNEIKTNKGLYAILVGRNVDLNIDHITYYNHPDYEFTSSVSTEETFLKYKKIPNNLAGTYPELTFFDKHNNIIQNPSY